MNSKRSELDPRPMLRWVPLSELNIDHAPPEGAGYQRPIEKKVHRIANGFLYGAAGACKVGKRGDGTLWVVDGQQRYEAAKARGLLDLPCVVFPSRGRVHEASVCKLVNTNHTRYPAVYAFHMAVVAGDEPQSTIAEWFSEHNIKMGGKSRRALSSPAAFVSLWKRDPDAAKTGLLTLFDILGLNETPLVGVFTGLWWVHHGGVDVAAYAEKLHRLGGQDEIGRLAKGHRRERKQEKENEKNYGLAVLDLINHKLRRKLVVA